MIGWVCGLFGLMILVVWAVFYDRLPGHFPVVLPCTAFVFGCIFIVGVSTWQDDVLEALRKLNKTLSWKGE